MYIFLISGKAGDLADILYVFMFITLFRAFAKKNRILFSFCLYVVGPHKRLHHLWDKITQKYFNEKNNTNWEKENCQSEIMNEKSR